MKILTIYHLETANFKDFETYQIKLEKLFPKMDAIIQCVADNQLQGIQYPYLVFETIEE
jgi:hypothetical protein